MPNLEATVFTTLKGLADVTKVNLVQGLNVAIANGTLTLTESALHTVTQVFSATVDNSVDTTHQQMLRIVDTTSKTKKKTSK